MAEDKKIKKCPVSLQPDIENLLQDLSPDDFASASRQEKDDFIQDRQSVSYWKDAWRRLKKNVVAMVALGVIVFLFLFAFVGPLLIPYGYDEFNKGAENLYPYHYTLEDTQRVNDEIASRTRRKQKLRKRARNLQRNMKQLSVQKQKLLQNLQKTLLRSRV